MNNVSLNDVEEVEKRLGVSLTREQRQHILEQYNRVVMDKAQSWDVILQDLILDLKPIINTNWDDEPDLMS
jgi:phenylalanyl-tRNA synthetase beta subunit